MDGPQREELWEPAVVRDLQLHPATFRFPGRASLLVAAVHWRPYVIVEPSTDGSLVVSGPMGKLLNVLAEKLNFSYSLVTPLDGSWGAELANGTWTGMVGQVSRKEVDLGLGPFSLSYSRHQVADFSETFYFSIRSILSSKGVPEIDPWGFLHPLAGSTWAAVVAALVVVWLMTVVVAPRPAATTSLHSWLGDLLFQLLRIFLNQGITIRKAVDERGSWAVLMSWVVVAAAVCWSYTGTLTSLLAVRHIPQPIQSLRDLLDDPAITVVMLPFTVVTNTISKMASGELRELHELRNVGRVRYEATSQFPLMLDTTVRHQRHSILEVAITLDMLIAEDFIKTNKCDFYKSRQTFFTTFGGMTAPKGSPILPAIDHRVRAVVESGLYQHWLHSEIPSITTCRLAPSIITVRERLSLANLWGLFVVLWAGLAVAVVLLCLEILLPPPRLDLDQGYPCLPDPTSHPESIDGNKQTHNKDLVACCC